MTDNRLILDGYGNKVQEQLASLIAEAKNDNLLAPVTIVVPSMYTGLSVRRSLGKQGGLVNVRFMVIPRLAEYLGAPALTRQGKSPLTPTMKLVAVRHFASEMANKEPLSSISNHPPLHDYLVNTFNELAMLSEKQLSWLQAKSPVLNQVVEWYHMYRELTQPYYDREELAHSAAASVGSGDAESVLKDLGFIIFYLITGFSPGELAFVSSLGIHKRCAVILGLTGEEDIDAENHKMASRLEPVLGKAASSVPGAENYAADHITIASDSNEEVRWAVRHIAQGAENGIPFHCMALLYRNATPYAELIKSHLYLAQIPAAGPDPVPLRDSAAGKIVLYLIDVFESDFARDSVMRWIAEAPVYTGGDVEFASRENALWEEVSGRAGIIRGAGQWSSRLERFCMGIEQKLKIEQSHEEDEEVVMVSHDEDCAEAGMRLKSFMERLSGSPPPADGSSWKDYSEWASQMMKKYSHLDEWPEAQIQSYERVTAVLQELGTLDSIEPDGTSLGGFRQMLDDCLKMSSGRLGPVGEGVFVGPLGAAHGMEFDTVQHTDTSESGAHTPIRSVDLEGMVAEEWLSVIHSIHNSMLSLGGLVPVDIHDYDIHSLAKWHDSGYRVDRHFLMTEGSVGQRALRTERASRSTVFTAWDGNVTSLAGRSRRLGVPGESAHSPTRLELWAKCPFRYYLQHILEVPVLEHPEEIMTISPLDRGSLVHEILERFVKTLQESGQLPGYGEPWDSNHRALLMQIAEEEFARIESLGLTGRPLLWDVVMSEIRDDLSLFLKKDSELRAQMMTRPVEVEWRFGFGEAGQCPPVVLDIGRGQRIMFRGVIDRLDSDESGQKLFIVDYKTGSSFPFRDMKDNPLGAGTHLQLPVYAMAARSGFGQECEVQAGYWFISARAGFETREIILSEQLERNFESTVRLIVSCIEGGLFPANPGSGGAGFNNCAYCDYARICSADTEIAWERKSQNPELAAYLGMITGTGGTE